MNSFARILLASLFLAIHASANPEPSTQRGYPKVGKILVDWDAAWAAAPDQAARVKLTLDAALKLEPLGSDGVNAGSFLAQRVRMNMGTGEFYKQIGSNPKTAFLVSGLLPADKAIYNQYAEEVRKLTQNKAYKPANPQWTSYVARPSGPVASRDFDVSILRQRAFQGWPGAMYDLLYIYTTGVGVPEDKDSALFWGNQCARFNYPSTAIPEDAAGREAYYQRFANAGSLYFSYWLSNLEIAKIENKELPHPVAARFRNLAEAGFEPAYATIANAHRTAYYGMGDLAEAKRLYQIRANRGESYSLNELAIVEIMMLHLEGHTDWPPARRDRVFDLLRKADAAGNTFAMRLLGQLYEMGIGVSEDKEIARSYYTRSAAAGFEAAAKDIARLDGTNQPNSLLLTSKPVNRNRILATRPNIVSELPNFSPIDLVDLRFSFSNKIGIRHDAFVDAYLQGRIAALGFKFPAWDASKPEAISAYWGGIAGRGSVFAAFQAGLQAATLGDDTLAARYFKQSADAGSPLGNIRYAELQLSGQGTPANKGEAMARIKRYAAAGEPYAVQTLASLEKGSWTMPSYLPKAPVKIEKPRVAAYFDVEARRAAAEAGDVGAMYDMKFAYWNARGVDFDNEASNDWGARMAKAGYVTPAYGETKEEHQKFWETLSETGSIAALWENASDYLDGDGIEKDAAKGAALMRQAAEGGNYRAQYFLGKGLKNGWWELAADKESAEKWLEKAIKSEDPDAHFELASCYLGDTSTYGGNKDALYNFEKAAVKGHRFSSMMAAALLCQGSWYPVAKDEVRGAAWLQQFAGMPALLLPPHEAMRRIEDLALTGNPKAMEAYSYALSIGFVGEERDFEALAWTKAVDLNEERKKELNGAQVAYSWIKGKVPKLDEAADAERESKALARGQEIVAAVNRSPFELPDFSRIKRADTVESPDLVKNSIELLQELSAKNWLAAYGTLDSGRLDKSPLYPEGLDKLLDRNPPNNAQHWLAILADIETPALDGAAAEKAITPILIGSAESESPEYERQQALRRVVGFRLFYGVDRPSDRPAAAAWLLLAAGGDELDEAYDYVARLITPEQLASAKTLYERIKTFFKGPLPVAKPPVDLVSELLADLASN